LACDSCGDCLGLFDWIIGQPHGLDLPKHSEETWAEQDSYGQHFSLKCFEDVY